MKVFALFCIIAVLLGLVRGNETCTSDGKTLKKGEQHKPAGECKVYECNGKELEVADICRPILQLDYPCPRTELDVSKPFPDCCARYDCEP